ncbi:MAG: PTS sugar transporter subunit IIA [Spirochaetaceae bacterium]|jgi:PTS system fructose-specific IIC component/PTS system nitrogen regulatory IIA component|nr:PTS sugar transporter subunit IIA [Spirochaetaceae bacterium]
MELVEIFRPEFIRTELDAEDKDEVFEELTDCLCLGAHISDREGIIDALNERECKMSTGIRKGIAIPHGKTDLVDKVYGVLGISRKGVDYEALDGQPVHLFFMMVAPKQDSEAHLRELKRLASVLDNPNFYTEMALQRSPQTAFAVLKKYEDIFVNGD